MHALPKPSMTLYLPLRITMRLQGCLVCPWLHNQAAIVLVSPLHGGPGAHDAGRRPEREIVQVLMHGVQESLFVCNTGSETFSLTKRDSLFLPVKPLEHILRSCCFPLETLDVLSACSSPAMEAKQVSCHPTPKWTMVVALGSHSESQEAA